MVPLHYALQGLLVAMGRHLVSSVQQVLTAVQVSAFVVLAPLAPGAAHRPQLASPAPLGLTVLRVD